MYNSYAQSAALHCATLLCTISHYLYTTTLPYTAPAEQFEGRIGLPAVPIESHDANAP